MLQHVPGDNVAYAGHAPRRGAPPWSRASLVSKESQGQRRSLLVHAALRGIVVRDQVPRAVGRPHPLRVHVPFARSSILANFETKRSSHRWSRSASGGKNLLMALKTTAASHFAAQPSVLCRSTWQRAAGSNAAAPAAVSTRLKSAIGIES